MDIQLPGLDGIAATGQIRAAFPDARILIVSDYGDERCVQRHEQQARAATC